MKKFSEDIPNKIIDCINDYYDKNNSLPSIRDIAEITGIAKTTTSDYIQRLVKDNILELDESTHRYKTQKITKIKKNLCNVAVVGEIACGTPILAEENITDYISISSAMLGQGTFFALQAKGNSMINADINDGDYVIVRQQNTAEEGQIVVALIDTEATLKRFYIDKDRKQVRLHPENDDMEDMYFDNISIQGVVKKIIKDAI